MADSSNSAISNELTKKIYIFMYPERRSEGGCRVATSSILKDQKGILTIDILWIHQNFKVEVRIIGHIFEFKQA